MHPMVKRNPRLVKLYEFDRQLRDKILGATGTERRDLIRLRRKVAKEIRSIDIWEPIREQMRKAEEAKQTTE